MSMLVEENFKTAELILLRDPLHPDRSRASVCCPAGRWLNEAVPDECLIGDWVAVAGGRVIPREEWPRHLLTPGAEILLYPRLGDSTIVKIVTGIIFPPLGVYWGLRAAGLPSWASGLLTGGLIGVQAFPAIENIVAGRRSAPTVPALSSGELSSSTTYGFGGIQNSTRIGAPIPVVYGQHRVGGQLIGVSVVTKEDNDVIHLLLALSEGEIATIYDSEIEINDQPIANYTGVTVEYRLGSNSQSAIGLFGDTGASTFPADAVLTTAFITYTTQGTNLNGFEVKITFPGGLFHLNNEGGFIIQAVTIEVDYKLVASGTWIQAPRVTYSKAQRAVVRDRIRVDGLPSGQYDIRVRRTTVESTDTSTVDTVHREAITEIVSDGYTYPNTAVMAVSALATNQLSGGMPRVTALVLGVKIKIWNQNGPYAYQVAWSNNPAWIVFDMLTSERYGYGRFAWRILYDTGTVTVTAGSVNFSGSGTGWTAANLRKGDVLHVAAKNAIGIVNTINYGAQTGTFTAVWPGGSGSGLPYAVRSNDLDIQSFVDWADFCDEVVPDGIGGAERRATCDFVFDADQENIWAAVLRICGIGQASAMKIGTSIRIKIERGAMPVQLFTMANIKAESFEEVFLPLKERANIFEVQFLNVANGYHQDTIVLEDPLLFTNSEQPRRKTVSGYGITKSSRAARLARFNQKVNRYITRTITFEVGLDAVACEPGDVIRFQHDVPQWGYGGRAGAGSTGTTIVLDREVTIESAIVYEVLVRHADDMVETHYVSNGVGSYQMLTIADTWTQTPAQGDIWAFGPVQISTKPFRIVTIERTQELDARITAVEYNDAVYDDSSVGGTDQLTYSLLGDLTGPPGPVKDLILLGQDGAIENVWVSFSPPGSANFHHANIYRTDSGVKILLGQSANGAFAIRGVTSGELVIVKVTSVSGVGIESNYADAPTASFMASDQNPPDVPTLVLEGDRLRWNYPDPPIDLAGFLVRFRPGTSSNWASATPAHDNLLLTTDLQIFRRSGIQTYLVKAVDRVGNESLTAKTLTVDFGVTDAENIVFATDHRALGWPGSFTNASILSGDLKADAGAFLWTSDAALLWNVNPTALLWTSVYTEMTYEFSLQPSADQLDATLKLPISMSGEWSMEYRSDSSRPLWSVDATARLWDADPDVPLWDPPGDYIQWPGLLDHLREQLYFVRITGHAGIVQAALQQLSVVLDVPDLIETLEDVPIAAGGTRLNLTGSYRNIVSVRPALEHDGGSAAYVKVMDKDAALGPLIQAFDSNNIATTALVDVVVHGY